ncbi:MAG: crotonase/enoyl-CoA hydratase family protein [Gammaproteobacteria bacterium]|nr:crotonase/enoyl-CoA hydratase family protein [Gammaproteobacteria bacterium]
MLGQRKEITVTQFTHLDLEFEPEHNMVWSRFKYPGRPCMSTDLVKDVSRAQKIIADQARSQYEHKLPFRLKYQVFCSELPGVFNLGGDLAYFIRLIRDKNRMALFDYAKECIDILYRNATNYEIPFTTIALVQGETLGGGFEAALSANLIIAEKGARFGFPETVFGMFPGMGAFNFLARKVAPGLAKRMIASGKVYTAEELYDMGVVDILVPDGNGKEAVYDYIQHQRNRSTGFYGLDRVIEQFNPLSYKELLDVITLWVDTAMQLSDKNIRLMEYLVRAQQKRWCREEVKLVSMAS